MCCLCSAYTPKEKASFYDSTSFPAVPLLHLKVRFYIPSNTTFPTKMAPLRNSPSSLSQHDLLMCMHVCVCLRMQWVFLIMSLCVRIFFSAGTFWSFSQSVWLNGLCECVSVLTQVYAHLWMQHMCKETSILMCVHVCSCICAWSINPILTHTLHKQHGSSLCLHLRHHWADWGGFYTSLNTLFIPFY